MWGCALKRNVWYFEEGYMVLCGTLKRVCGTLKMVCGTLKRMWYFEEGVVL